MKIWTWLASVILGGLILTGCGSPSAPVGGKSTTLKMALVPSEDAEKMASGFEPIRVQLEKDTGFKIELIKVTDYASVIEAMRAGKVDIAWYGPLSMILAHQETGSEPFAIAVIEGKGESYHSLLVAKKSAGINTIEDLGGKRLGLVDPGSTSGNLVPRSLIMNATQKKAEDLVKEVSYLGSHDASLLALMSGSVDVCAVQDITFDKMVEEKKLDPADYTIVVKSEPLPQSPLAFRKDLGADAKKKIIDSLLKVTETTGEIEVPGMGKVLKFVDIDLKAYDPIQKMADLLKLTKEQMVK